MVEIRADSNDVDSVTVQRSYFKLQPGGSITLSQQFVQVGEVTRKQEVLYGTMTRGPCDLSSFGLGSVHPAHIALPQSGLRGVVCCVSAVYARF